jgi:hypothetical protein
MPIDRAAALPLEEAIADVAADCLEALIAEIQDATLRERLVDLPAVLRTALLGGPGWDAAGRAVREQLDHLELATADHAPSLADEAATFRDALALMRDDLGEPSSER